MELDDLLKEEGLDAAGVEDALAWARRRAAELVRDVDGDPELGPLLGGARAVGELEAPPLNGTESSPRAKRAAEKPRPLFNDLRGLQAAFLAEADDEDADLPEVGAVLRAFQKGRSGPVRAARAPVKAKPVETSDAVPAELGARDEALVDRGVEAGEAAVPSVVAEAPAGATADVELDDRAEAGGAVATHDEADASDGSTAMADEGTATPPMPVPLSSEILFEALTTSDGSIPVTGSEAASDATDEGAAAHGLPAPPEADLDPLAGIDFDDLPGVDEDDEEEDHTHIDLPVPHLAAVPVTGDQELEGRTTLVPTDAADMTLPSMQVPLSELGLGRPRVEGASAGELTERPLEPPLPAEPAGEVTVTAMAPNPLRGASPDTAVISDVTAPAPVEAPPAEEPAEEIELLDDEDLLLVDEEPEAADDEGEEVPEWKRALLESAGDD